MQGIVGNSIRPANRPVKGFVNDSIHYFVPMCRGIDYLLQGVEQAETAYL